jgi:CheY-like chemotaxis protein/Tfp pilus assembly protein PilZ
MSGPLLVCGVDPSEALRATAADLDLDLFAVSSLDEVQGRLAGAPPHCFLVDCSTKEGAAVCQGVRMASELADTPIIAVIDDPWSASLAQSFALGADDYVPVDAYDPLRRKLLALRKEGVLGAAFLSGQVVLADPSRERRVHLARNLSKMGLQVRFAVEAGEIPCDVGVKLIVAHCTLAPSGVVRGVRSFRGGPGARIPWVIVGTHLELEAVKEQLQQERDIRFLDVEADPAQIAFTANQLVVGASRSMRRSARLTYETAARFDVLAGGHAEWGYTYNINRGGIYVRTLTPPSLGLDLMLELVPPYGQQRVTIEGRVVWRQEYCGSKGYPPGFGVQYAEKIADETNAALEAGYNQLLVEAGNPAA